MEDYLYEARSLALMARRCFNVSFVASADGYFGSFKRDGNDFHSVPSNNEHKGKGELVLRLLCAIADAHKVELLLFCEYEKCRQLYERCGFYIYQHREDGSYNRWDMKRNPIGGLDEQVYSYRISQLQCASKC